MSPHKNASAAAVSASSGEASGGASAVAVIPARLESVRFPRKLLASATGRPLIQHVWEQARQARRISRVVVATDSAEIAESVRTFGAEAAITRADHPNGTSRIAEVAPTLDAAVVVNVQGDEPELAPELIDRVVELLDERPECPMATLAAPILDEGSAADPNVVKLVRRQDGTALYFSRASIPHRRPDAPAATMLRHIGLYAYRREFLPRYVALPETPLERSERLEQLRALEHGHSIAVAVVDAAVHGIDTPEQYEAFVARWRQRG